MTATVFRNARVVLADQVVHGVLEVAADLAAEGFIHCSFLHQVMGVSRRHYGGQQGLVLFCIDPTAVDCEIRVENTSGGTELYPHIGPYTDVPAGDIGVGIREVSYLFGQYKRLSNTFTGVMTGKGLSYGGSQIRTEATGYGCVYMMEDMLATTGETLEGKVAVVSGSGNVAQYAVDKLIEQGAKPVTMSDSSGFIYDANGIDCEKLKWVRELKDVRRGRIAEYAAHFGAEYHAGKRPWHVPCDIAFPCATQNELNVEEAQALLANGCVGVSEGANMPSEQDAIDAFQAARILFPLRKNHPQTNNPPEIIAQPAPSNVWAISPSSRDMRIKNRVAESI